MTHIFIMDPVESVKPWKDTTYYLMLAAFNKGHKVGWCQQKDLYLKGVELSAVINWVSVHEDHQKPFTALSSQAYNLGQSSAVWLRTDPPFDRRYFYTTLLLDFLPDSVTVVNKPQGVRDWNEKLAATHYPEFTPHTLVTNSIDEIKKFSHEHKRLTMKPIDGFGGKGIFFYQQGDDDIGLRTITHDESQWVIAQEYLPKASEGDKRILLLNGEPIGAILRVHADGVELNNLDAGGKAVASELDADDLAICAALKQGLTDKGIIFAGIDVIGGKLIEVNVTSPTGLQELSRFSGLALHQQIIDAVDAV